MNSVEVGDVQIQQGGSVGDERNKHFDAKELKKILGMGFQQAMTRLAFEAVALLKDIRDNTKK